MRLTQKLLLYALAVALIPLAATGITLIRLGEEALRQRIQEHQQTAAIAIAEKVSLAVEELARRVANVTELVDIKALSQPEREGLLRLLYRQSVEISIAALLDAQGHDTVTPVFLEPGSEVGAELAGHRTVTPDDVRRLHQYLPDARTLAQVRPGDVVMSAVYYPDAESARLTVAVPGSFDSAGAAQALFAVELALREQVLRVDGIETGLHSRVFVVDRTGRAILHPSLPTGTDLRGDGAVHAFLDAGTRGRGALSVNVEQAAWAAAYAPVGSLGWGVVVEQPEADAFAVAVQMRERTLWWIFGTTAVVLLSSLVFADSIRKSLAALVGGARAFGEGRLTHSITVGSSDEVGELAATMNTMAAQLSQSLKDLQAWSHTLEDKVEARTSELKATQGQLLLQAEMAAIGQLGAGVAHEVNNPLAALLGHVQLLLYTRSPDSPDYAALKQIEEAANRCRTITMNLLRFSERGEMGRQEVAINDVVRDVVTLMKPTTRAAGLELSYEVASELPVIVADPGSIQVVLINLMTNARDATPEGGKIVVSTSVVPEGVSVSVRDTGRGIEAEHLQRVFEPFFTTKQVWTGTGLGLSIVYRIVTDHGGKVSVESKLAEGSTFTVFLPTRYEQAVESPRLEPQKVGIRV